MSYNGDKYSSEMIYYTMPRRELQAKSERSEKFFWSCGAAIMDIRGPG